MGIVRFRSRGVTQDGAVVLEYSRSVMVWRRDAAPSVDTFPEPRLNENGTPRIGR
jgi:hypothetical protein